MEKQQPDSQVGLRQWDGNHIPEWDVYVDEKFPDIAKAINAEYNAAAKLEQDKNNNNNNIMLSLPLKQPKTISVSVDDLKDKTGPLENQQWMKICLLQMQIDKACAEFPIARIDFQFYDDRGKQFFKPIKKYIKLPPNVTLKLFEVNESRLTKRFHNSPENPPALNYTYKIRPKTTCFPFMCFYRPRTQITPRPGSAPSAPRSTSQMAGVN